MKPATKRFLNSGLSLILVISAFVIYFDLVRPAYDDAVNVRTDMISRENFVKNQKEAIDQVNALIASYGERTDLKEVVSSALPPTPDVSGALAQINGIAALNRLSPQSFSVAAAAQSPRESAQANPKEGSESFVKPIGILDFQVKIVGSYEDLRNFLKNLETNIRIMDLKSLSIQPFGKPGQNIYNFDMTVGAYYQNP